MEYIRGFLYDSLAQTTIIGPLASFVVGIILAKVFGNTGGNSPSVVERRVIIIERRVTERREERRTSSDADPFLIGVALFGAVALAAWAYVAFLAEIVRWLDLGIRSAAALTLGFFAWSFISTGMSGRWLFEAAVAFGTLAFAAWLVGVPPETISAEVSAFARSMNFMKFWNEGLNDWGRRLVPAQALGMCATAVAAVFATLRAVHLTTLAAVDRPSGPAFAIASATAGFGSGGAVAGLIAVEAMAWLLVVGSMRPDGPFWRLLDAVLPR